MATVKTQGGKVITKNGKVSCTCCEEPQCCMYPALGLINELYTYEDLPDTVVFVESNQIFNRVNPPEEITEGSIIYYRAPDDPENDTYLYTGTDTESWVRYSGGSIGGPGPCLINAFDGPNPFPDSFEDQFADTYTVAWNISDQSGSSTATRQSLCIWTFTALGEEYLIEYESVDFFRWRIVTPETEIFKAEPSFENTPTGYYETGNQDFTVS